MIADANNRLHATTGDIGRTRISKDAPLEMIVEQACEAMARHSQCYIRGQSLVMVRPRQGRAPTIEPAGRSHVLAWLSTTCQFVVETRGGELREVEATDRIAAAILEYGTYHDVRPLHGILSAPTLRRDGTLLRARGYDVATGLLLSDHAPAIDLPTRPTRAQVEEGVAILSELVTDFPFADPSSLSAWIDLVVTTLCRHAIDGSIPAYLIDANVAGSGKTKLVQLVSAIAFGEVASTWPYPSDPNEAQKLLLTLAVSGTPLVALDNVETGATFGGPALDQVLTSPRIAGRILGQTKSIEVDWSAVVVATGNNLRVAGDTLRRLVVCRLASTIERPETRSGFAISGDIVQHAIENRERYIRAALTIVLGYLAAGRPRGDLEPTDFVAWSTFSREAVYWATGHDPLGARESMRAWDIESSTAEDLVRGWAALQAAQATFRGGVSVSDARAALDRTPDDHGLLRDVVSAWSRDGRLPTVDMIAKRLARYRDRVTAAGTLRFTRTPTSRLWSVQLPPGEDAIEAPKPGSLEADRWPGEV